jgi:acyl-CoA thioester hydrolase
MQIYEKNIIVSIDDLDELNHVNNVRYVQWVNDIAKAHWEQNASTEILSHYFWVLLNHNISYQASAMLNENLLLKTFVASSEGVSSTRIVEMYNTKTNKLIVRSETKWCLMSKQRLKPSRITTEITNLFN